MTSVAVIDYGMGNLHSATKALKLVAATLPSRYHVFKTSNPDDIRNCDKVIFPGVGAIRDCIREMRERGIISALEEVLNQKPCLAICIGMQSLLERSEENGGVDCLGLFKGEVKHFEVQAPLRVPHMGWNQVEHDDHPIWQDIPQNTRFYFVHSYYVCPSESQWVIGRCTHGHAFTAAMAKGNLVCTQFHPEKSHHFGLQLLKNFLSWQGN